MKSIKVRLIWALAYGRGFFSCLTGCHADVRLRALDPQIEVPGKVRVRVTGLAGDELTLNVANLSLGTLGVRRDMVVLQTPRGERQHEPGGMLYSLNVASGAAQDFTFQFDFSDCTKGADMVLSFERALELDSLPVSIPPVRLRCE